MTPTTLVVPCFNEEARQDHAAFCGLVLGTNAPRVIFVNDGSEDGTLTLLQGIVNAQPDRFGLIDLGTNHGKAEAVRRGLRAALSGALFAGEIPEIVGYIDADLATPIVEIQRLLALLNDSPADVLIAARVALLGHDIHRDVRRHYLGRFFATAAALALRQRIYDTQCGAKLFRNTKTLGRILEEPFHSRWIFDVELLGRLLIGTSDVPAIPSSRFLEEPLRTWRDVPGSKIRARHFAVALIDFIRISEDLRKRRRAVFYGPVNS